LSPLECGFIAKFLEELFESQVRKFIEDFTEGAAEVLKGAFVAGLSGVAVTSSQLR